MDDSNPYENTTETRPQLTKYERDVRMWSMFIHFSVLAGLVVVPIAGWILPIVLWQIKKDELPEIDVHGKIVVNWLCSTLVYGTVFLLLSFFIIGIPLLVLLWIATIIYSIIGGIKANSGEVWEYPLNIKFL